MDLARLEREVRMLKGYAAISTVLLVMVILYTTSTSAQNQRQRFTEIDVERINVIEPNGTPALVITNTQPMPRIILDGKEVAPELVQDRRGSAGMIFVDGQGNEVGGLLYHATVRPDGTYDAVRHLSFDQHNQDQVLGIQYVDDGKNRMYGLSLWDRPTQLTTKEFIELAQGTRDPKVLEQRLGPVAKQRGLTRRPGLRRVFLGHQDGNPALRLADVEGRERLRLLVDATGAPRMEFLDETGRVIQSLPQ